jgi:hypothetical protein
MAWSVVFQRERLEAGVHSDHGDVDDPGIYAKHHERPDKARDLITAATQHTCTIFASSCAESSISSFLI